MATSKRDAISNSWGRYLKKRNVDSRNRLIEHYRPLVHIQAARLSQKMPSQITYDELCSAGYIGLMESVESYDPSFKAKFETYCQRRITGAMMDWVRDMDGQSRTVRKFERNRDETINSLKQSGDEAVNDKTVAEKIGMTYERFIELSRISRTGQLIYFSADKGSKDLSGKFRESPKDIEDREAVSPIRRIEEKMYAEYINRGLNREERLILVLYYTENLSMNEIGKVLDLSESRVSQIHKDTLQRLRKRFQSREVA